MLFIFDMGGVVTNTFQIDSLYNRLKLSEAGFDFVCKMHDKDIWEQLTIGKLSTDSFWAEFNRRIECLQHEKDIEKKALHGFDTKLIQKADCDLFRLFFHPVENRATVELIKNLKKNNRVVCGTNTIQSHWENHTERGDYSYFHQTYASNKIGAAKPDTHFFELILEAECYRAEDAFFTDDRQENCDAAASIGMNAEHFTTAEELTQKWSKYF